MVIIATNYQGYGDGIGDGDYHEWLDGVDGIDDDGVEGVGIPHICHFFSTYPIFYKNFLHAKARKSRQNGSHKNNVKQTLWQKTG